MYGIHYLSYEWVSGHLIARTGIYDTVSISVNILLKHSGQIVQLGNVAQSGNILPIQST